MTEFRFYCTIAIVKKFVRRDLSGQWLHEQDVWLRLAEVTVDSDAEAKEYGADNCRILQCGMDFV